MMAASLVGGAALGGVFGELLKAALDAKDKATKFKPTLANLTTTLTAIDPLIKEMIQQNHELGRPQEELESLIREMKEGTKLVHKCSKIHWLNICCMIQHQVQLMELRESLERFFNIDMQAQMARDVKETLLELRRMRTMVNNLSLLTIQASQGTSHPSVESATERVHLFSQREIHDLTATTQLPNENATEINSIVEDLSQRERQTQPPDERAMETNSDVKDLSQRETHDSIIVEDLSQPTTAHPPNENAMETNISVNGCGSWYVISTDSGRVPIPDYVSDIIKSRSMPPTVEAARQVMEGLISCLSEKSNEQLVRRWVKYGVIPAIFLPHKKSRRMRRQLSILHNQREGLRLVVIYT